MTYVCKNKTILSVSVDHDIFAAIDDVCTRHVNRSAVTNDLLREILVEKRMLEA